MRPLEPQEIEIGRELFGKRFRNSAWRKFRVHFGIHDTETVCLLKHPDVTGCWTATATCSPDDEFDTDTGSLLAFIRALRLVDESRRLEKTRQVVQFATAIERAKAAAVSLGIRPC